MTSGYTHMADQYKHRRRGSDWKRYSHNQVILYDEKEDCYMHKHHSTITVKAYPDKYKLYTGGWYTKTTFEKIREFCPAAIYSAPRSNIQGQKFVYWRGIGTTTRCFTEFYDGIEVDFAGVPLKPEPYKVRVVKRGATKPLRDAARVVLNAVHHRMLIGEFDASFIIHGREENGDNLMRLLLEAAKDPDNIDPDALHVLFRWRKAKWFGAARWSHGDDDAPPAIKRFKANVEAACRAYLGSLDYGDAYVWVEKPAFER